MRGTPQSLEPQCELHGGYQEVCMNGEEYLLPQSLVPPVPAGSLDDQPP